MISYLHNMFIFSSVTKMSFEIVTLLQSIRDRGEQFEESDSDTKQALLHSARNLVAALEPTHETVLRILTNSVCSKP
jgi:hypothetical protein